MSTKQENVKLWVSLWIASLIGPLAVSILTRSKEFKMYNTVEERRAAERDQELRDSIAADVKEALKDLP